MSISASSLPPVSTSSLTRLHWRNAAGVPWNPAVVAPVCTTTRSAVVGTTLATTTVATTSSSSGLRTPSSAAPRHEPATCARDGTMPAAKRRRGVASATTASTAAAAAATTRPLAAASVAAAAAAAAVDAAASMAQDGGNVPAEDDGSSSCHEDEEVVMFGKCGDGQFSLDVSPDAPSTTVRDPCVSSSGVFAGESLQESLQWLYERELHRQRVLPGASALGACDVQNRAIRCVLDLVDSWHTANNPSEALESFLRRERAVGVPSASTAAPILSWRSPNMRHERALYDYQFFAVLYALHRMRHSYRAVRGLMMNFSPGLGKTATTLSLVDLMYTPERGPALVVCPSSVLYAWSTDIEKFFGRDVFPYLIFHRDWMRSAFDRVTYYDLFGGGRYKLIITTYDTLATIYRRSNVDRLRAVRGLRCASNADNGNADDGDDGVVATTTVNDRRRTRLRGGGDVTRGRQQQSQADSSDFFAAAYDLLDQYDGDGDDDYVPARRFGRSGRRVGVQGPVLDRHLIDADVDAQRHKKGSGLVFLHRYWLVVWDESQYASNVATRRHEASTALAKEQALLLTGTPIRNRIEELQAQFEGLLGARTDGGTWTSDTFSRYGFDRIMLSVSYDDAGVRMPPLRQSLVEVQMTDEQRAIYDVFHRRAKGRYQSFAQGYESFAHVLSDLMRMRQVGIAPYLLGTSRRRCALRQRRRRAAAAAAAAAAVAAGTVNTDDSDDNERLRDPLLEVQSRLGVNSERWCLNGAGEAGVRSPKILAAVTLVRKIVRHSSTSKVVIYSMFAEALKILGCVLSAVKIGYTIVLGADNGPKRQRLFDDFRFNDSIRVCLMPYAVGSVGLTLVEANHCIMLEPWYCFATHLQALFRLWRIGQRRTVRVHWLVTRDTVEKRVLEICARKIEVTNRVLQQTRVDNLPHHLLQNVGGNNNDDESSSDDDDDDYTENETTSRNKRKCRSTTSTTTTTTSASLAPPQNTTPSALTATARLIDVSSFGTGALLRSAASARAADQRAATTLISAVRSPTTAAESTASRANDASVLREIASVLRDTSRQNAASEPGYGLAKDAVRELLFDGLFDDDANVWASSPARATTMLSF